MAPILPSSSPRPDAGAAPARPTCRIAPPPSRPRRSRDHTAAAQRPVRPDPAGARPVPPRSGRRAGTHRLGGGRRPDRCGAGGRRPGAGRRAEPTRPDGQRHPARGDRLHRAGRPAAGVGLPPQRPLHDPLALPHVRGDGAALRHPAHRRRGEPQLPGLRGAAPVARRAGRRAGRPGLPRPHGADAGRAAGAVARGHRGGVVTAPGHPAPAVPDAEVVDPDYPVTPVPAHARKSFLSIAVVLLGFTVFTPTMLAGATLGPAFAFDDLVLVILAGSLILGAYVAVMGWVGARTGLTTVVMARYTLGTRGAKLASILLGGTQIGWYGVVGTI